MAMLPTRRSPRTASLKAAEAKPNRSQITGCTNLGQLKKWVQRAAIAEKASDLFA